MTSLEIFFLFVCYRAIGCLDHFIEACLLHSFVRWLTHVVQWLRVTLPSQQIEPQLGVEVNPEVLLELQNQLRCYGDRSTDSYCPNFGSSSGYAIGLDSSYASTTGSAASSYSASCDATSIILAQLVIAAGAMPLKEKSMLAVFLRFPPPRYFWDVVEDAHKFLTTCRERYILQDWQSCIFLKRRFSNNFRTLQHVPTTIPHNLSFESPKLEQRHRRF